MLDTPAIDAYITSGNKKSGELLDAYKTAKDPSDWEALQRENAERFRNQLDGPDEIQSDGGEDEDELEDDDGSAGDKRKRKGDKKAANGKKVKTEKDKKSKVSAFLSQPTSSACPRNMRSGP
jgi:hypothetical protein